MDVNSINHENILKMLDWKIRSMEKALQERDKRIEELEFKLSMLNVHN